MSLPCRVTLDLQAHQRQLDDDGLLIDAWRGARKFDLQCGSDVDGMMDAIPDDKAGEFLSDLVGAALRPTVDERVLAVNDVMDRIIECVLNQEESKGLWREEFVDEDDVPC